MGCQLRSGASRAYSTAVGKEVVIVGCARSLKHISWIPEKKNLVCSCSGPPWVVLEAHWLPFLLPSWELWLYLQPLTGLAARKKLWMRFIWGLCFRKGWARHQIDRQCWEQEFPSPSLAHLLTRFVPVE